MLDGRVGRAVQAEGLCVSIVRGVFCRDGIGWDKVTWCLLVDYLDGYAWFVETCRDFREDQEI